MAVYGENGSRVRVKKIVFVEFLKLLLLIFSHQIMDWDSIFSRQKRMDPYSIAIGIGSFFMWLFGMSLDVGLTVKNDDAVWWQNARSDREALVSERVRIGSEEFNAAKVLYYDTLERLETKVTKAIATMQEKVNAADTGMRVYGTGNKYHIISYHTGMVYYSEQILRYEAKTWPVFDRAELLKDEVTSKLNKTKQMGLDYLLKGTHI